MKKEAIVNLVRRIGLNCMGKQLEIRVEEDQVYRHPVAGGRLFLQVVYRANDTRKIDRPREQEWHGRKWYLSEHMLPDEVVKTAFAAFKAAVEHEVMEGFTWDGRRVFNPHTPYDVLLEASEVEVARITPQQ
jgi:hypothetical protein